MSTFQTAGAIQAIELTETGHMESRDMYKNMRKRFSRLFVGFGAAQIAIGILCFIINGVTLGRHLYSGPGGFSDLGGGLCAGVLFIITGGIGVGAGKSKTKCLVVSFNLLCIISASICFYLFIFAVIYNYTSQRGCSRYDYYDHRHDYSGCGSAVDTALGTMLAILAFLEAGCAIGASVVCCTFGACCCDCDCGCCCPPSMPQYKMQDNGEQPQPTEMPSQQQVFLYPPQPTYIPGANQMTMPAANQMAIPPGQQQPVMLLNPNQQVAQYNPQQVPASSHFPKPKKSGMMSSIAANFVEQLADAANQ